MEETTKSMKDTKSYFGSPPVPFFVRPTVEFFAAKICKSEGNRGCRGYARINTNGVNWPPGAPQREIRGFSFSSQSRVVRGSTSSFSRPSIFFSAEKETKLKKPEKSSIFVKIFRFSTMARVVVAQRPVAVLCSILECCDWSPCLRGRCSLRRRARFVGGLRQ